MKKPYAALLLVGHLLMPVGADSSTVFSLRIYQGFRDSVGPSPLVISSYYLGERQTVSLPPDRSVSREKASLSRVFNLQGIKLITEGNLFLDTHSQLNRSLTLIHHPARIEIRLSSEGKAGHLFRVEIVEDGVRDPSPLLNTELIIPPRKTAILGFEDSRKRIYFLSLQRLPPSPSPGDALPAVIPHHAPHLLHRVDPVYPRTAVESGVQGMVRLEGEIAASGRIENIRVTRGADDVLVQAAIDAIRQWRYRPLSHRGKPLSIPFAITVNYLLDAPPNVVGGPPGSSTEPPRETASKDTEVKQRSSGRVRFTIDTRRLRLTHRVDPVYPAAALASGIEGEVKIAVLIDKMGNVAHTKALSGNPVLAVASINAIRQWKFEPYFLLDRRSEVLVVVTVVFGHAENTVPRTPSP